MRKSTIQYTLQLKLLTSSIFENARNNMFFRARSFRKQTHGDEHEDKCKIGVISAEVFVASKKYPQNALLLEICFLEICFPPS